jgi:hypothetical protein
MVGLMAKICDNCKYHDLGFDANYIRYAHWCKVKAKRRQNLITGDIFYDDICTCFSMRLADGDCGPDAKLYKRKWYKPWAEV